MALMIHDTTGTQTDCGKPLSRKKLKQLMPQSSMRLTARMLYEKTGRLSPAIKAELARMEREKKAMEKAATDTDGTTFKWGDPKGVVEETAQGKPNIFKRLKRMFDALPKQDRQRKRKVK
jgi:5-hydroxyisourate hydrolase-like protein (transthyretin family)